MTDYRLLSVGEVIREGDEVFLGAGLDAGWAQVAEAVGYKVCNWSNPIRRRTTLRADLAELADQMDAETYFTGGRSALNKLHTLIAKHYPTQEPQP